MWFLGLILVFVGAILLQGIVFPDLSTMQGVLLVWGIAFIAKGGDFLSGKE